MQQQANAKNNTNALAFLTAIVAEAAPASFTHVFVAAGPVPASVLQQVDGVRRVARGAVLVWRWLPKTKVFVCCLNGAPVSDATVSAHARSLLNQSGTLYKPVLLPQQLDEYADPDLCCSACNGVLVDYGGDDAAFPGTPCFCC